MLLQAGQLLSNAGTQSTSIAYPLLVLAVTGSAAKAGVVAFARTLPAAVFALPAGLAADRWNRKWLMLAADGVRVLAIGGLAAAILLHAVPYWAIVLVAFIEGVGAAFFSVAYTGALRAVVPTRQLPSAAGAQTGRQAAVQLAGPPLGGALFGLARALPFLVDAVSYTFSTLSLLAMRTPFQEEREPDLSRLRSRLAEGLRLPWSQPFLRTRALLFGLSNFIGPGLLLAVVVIGTRQGLSGGEGGALVAALGPCLLVGSFLAPLGPLAAGVLLETVSARATIALFAVFGLVLAVWGTLSPSIRAAPKLDELHDAVGR